MTFPNALDREAAGRIVDTALDRGINFIYIADESLSEALGKQIDDLSGATVYTPFRNQPVQEGPALGEQW